MWDERTKGMIQKIEIQYFRSIYRETITDIKDLNVFTGKNDVGKSNVLKALNLFFNNSVENSGDYLFSENYNLRRLNEVRKDTIKGKQFIQIKITFRRGLQYEKTLPETFTVTKKWNRDSVVPQISDDIAIQLKKDKRIYNDRCRASLTRFLNGIKYVYVPAIKDKYIFDNILRQLQSTVYKHKLSGNESLEGTLNSLYDHVVETTQELSDDFERKTNVKSMIATPKEVDELYRTLQIITQVEGGAVKLENRGDGIRVRYLPAILYYIANNTNEKYIWGFEEPENSLEFNLAIEMADDFYNIYSKKSIIFLTTHSPAFIDLGYRERCNGYRCYKENESTHVVSFKEADKLPLLADELGYAKILRKQYEDYQNLRRINKEQEETIDKLKTELMISQKPILLTEGKTDAIILSTAWGKLYDYECPFDIQSCNLLSDEEKGNTIAGASILSKILCSVRYDSSRIVIGLFDNDKAGQNAYELDGNYKVSENKQYKKHKNEKGYALLIPADGDLKEIADIKNLSIEYLFPRESLGKEIDGKKLRFVKDDVCCLYNGIKIKRNIHISDEDLWYYSKINDSSKTEFAKIIVPTFEENEFKNFRHLFEIVLEILENVK